MPPSPATRAPPLGAEQRRAGLDSRRRNERDGDPVARSLDACSECLQILVCGTVYGVTAVILDVPYPLALAVIAGILDLIPSIGATIAGIIVALVALSVSPAAFVVFLIVMVVYQQIENYILQPTIIGKAARISGFTVLASVLVFGALFGLIGAIIGVPIAAGIQIVVEELTAARRARIAAVDAAV